MHIICPRAAGLQCHRVCAEELSIGSQEVSVGPDSASGDDAPWHLFVRLGAYSLPGFCLCSIVVI